MRGTRRVSKSLWVPKTTIKTLRLAMHTVVMQAFACKNKGMKIQCRWQDSMSFVASSNHHQVSMDAMAPLGKDSGLSPKQLLLAAVCGCTGMDVAALLKKHKQVPSSLQIDAEAEVTTGGHPKIFKEIRLTFAVQGPVDAAVLKDAVRLSQTQYCGVSAMVSKAVPIRYAVVLNGTSIDSGNADFKF